jgi:malonate transporter
VTALALIIHPVIALWVCWWFELTEDVIRSIVLMAAMAPGLNAYLFATLYKRGEAVAASTVIMATALSVLTLSLWLVFLR